MLINVLEELVQVATIIRESTDLLSMINPPTNLNAEEFICELKNCLTKTNNEHENITRLLECFKTNNMNSVQKELFKTINIANDLIDTVKHSLEIAIIYTEAKYITKNKFLERRYKKDISKYFNNIIDTTIYSFDPLVKYTFEMAKTLTD